MISLYLMMNSITKPDNQHAENIYVLLSTSKSDSRHFASFALECLAFCELRTGVLVILAHVI